MRLTGIVDDVACPAVHDHPAWAGQGVEGLARTARRSFGAAAPSELLLLVSSDGSACGLEDEFADDLASGRLVTMHALETYSPVLDGGVDACAAQLRHFDSFLDDAIAGGFSAIRVVADNTDMLAGTDEQVRNWLAWEQLPDRWQTLRPVNGNCYFDTTRIDPARLRAAVSRHPVTVGAAAPWRLFWEQDETGALRVVLTGEVEAFDEPDLAAALSASLDIGTVDERPLTLRLGEAESLHHSIPFTIAGLAERGCGLRVGDVSPAVHRLLRWLPPLAAFPA